MRFNPDLLALIPVEQLEAEFGGKYEYKFEAESYWEQICRSARCFPVILFQDIHVKFAQVLRRTEGRFEMCTPADRDSGGHGRP
jgi:hypothetical protein